MMRPSNDVIIIFVAKQPRRRMISSSPWVISAKKLQDCLGDIARKKL